MMNDGWFEFGATPEDEAGTEPTPAIPQGKTFAPPGYREEVRGHVDPADVSSGLKWAVGIIVTIIAVVALLVVGYPLVFWIAGL